MWGMGGGDGFWGGGWWGFGMIGMWVFWILVIVVVIALARGMWGRNDAARADRSPLDILKERYARGEIEKKEYEQKKRELAQ